MTSTKRVFAVCVSPFLPPVSSHPSPITYSHAAARWFSDERAYLFHTNNSSGTEKCSRKKKTKKNLTALKQVQDALPSFAWLYNLLIPPYFCFSKRGTLYCSALETLPPKVYSNSTRQRAGWREKGKKTQGKVGEKYKQKPGKYYNHLWQLEPEPHIQMRVYLPPLLPSLM